ncbi:ankyrin repeat and IBR domain-containing protein 1-like isoform X1 [Schistocerca nitens]|uniref:ankyrin repeat and IBR domain-containing protein 1-like isoform X1 n=3 Tax=Schistocerca nitens TaxID=7011 RepID=UPI002118FE23|nr:ankyrin repeat and IBR domain-containing protein 1-like isoform X1 [Schistocerca nitens]
MWLQCWQGRSRRAAGDAPAPWRPARRSWPAMGSASSKFKKYLQHGDEFAAMQVFQSSAELRRNLDPNVSYGESHGHNTALHYAARHGMKHLLRTFLNDLAGNPNKRNAANETALHAACTLPAGKPLSAQERRAACAALLLQWRGAATPGGGAERVDLRAQDQKGNTALHCAASSGLERCVELLLAHGAPLFQENHDKLTPCDLAMRASHHDIARLLESRMVFADSSDSVNEAELYGSEPDEVYSGLRTQDLQEAKDQLLVETSDMLHVPLFTAEALLRDNEWSREALLDKWMKDAVACCQLAGVQPPASALQLRDSGSTPSSPVLQPPDIPPDPEDLTEPVQCEICTLPVSEETGGDVSAPCGHRFCTSCWENYLTVKIQAGDAHGILCPAYQCPMLVPADVIEKLVSPDMARRYLQFDIEAFVESNRSIKWCPMPGCGRAVRLPEYEQPLPGSRSGSPPPTSHAVDCGNGHFFCWECLGEAHAPCGCQQWQQWQRKISEVRPEELRASCTETEDAANCLWLVTNSKPCPNCKSPIQKNEGCNHMKCSKCKCDFCWVCLENWKKHSSATGGYFRCNRFEAVHKADERQGALITEAVVRNQQVQELNRFLHYYTRFKNHENSHRLEEPLLINARQKAQLLLASTSTAQGPGTGQVLGTGQVSSTERTNQLGPEGARFVEDGVRELLKARRVLCGSYVHGYYLHDNGYSKSIFEFMQNELEEVTERLSEMVARPYLRTPRAVIIQTTALARRKRHEFVRAVSKGLVPPETPPSSRRMEGTVLPMDQAVMTNPWVKELQGHPGTMGIPLEWQPMDSDEDDSPTVTLLGKCERIGCPHPRARNPRTGELHAYCSWRCSHLATATVVNGPADYNVDLVIALEMSRLQMIEDEFKKRQREEADTGEPSRSGNREDQHQLELAIELSLCDREQQQDTVQETENDQDMDIDVDVAVDNFLRSLAGQRLDASSETGSGSSTLQSQGPGPGSKEDGRFQIGELHQNGWVEGPGSGTSHLLQLRRAHSTGDLCCARPPPPPPPAFLCAVAHTAHNADLVEHAGGPGGQSSMEDTTTTTTASDSLNADLEVCGILGTSTSTATEEEPDPDPEAAGPSTSTSPAPAATSVTVSNAQLRAPSQARSLRIRICRSPGAGGGGSGGVQSTTSGTDRARGPLETDSSNEYESETGIPRSPTLFISGVSISRTPEPAAVPTLPPPAVPEEGSPTSGAASIAPTQPISPASVSPAPSSPRDTASVAAVPTTPAAPAPGQSRSASEPERERSVFRFPKSQTDGALSSVLLVQESNLSSDDFHEALFLLEPKESCKRRKKSKKERHKEASSAL